MIVGLGVCLVCVWSVFGVLCWAGCVVLAGWVCRVLAGVGVGWARCWLGWVVFLLECWYLVAGSR